MWPLLWFCPSARQLLWSLTGCCRTHRIGRLAALPPHPAPHHPSPPVVSLKSPILLPQNVGATLMSELPRCPDKLSVSAEQLGRCPNVATGGWRINCNYKDNRPAGTRTLSHPFCLSPIIHTLGVKDTHKDGATAGLQAVTALSW